MPLNFFFSISRNIWCSACPCVCVCVCVCVCERSKVYDEIVIALGDSKNRLELPTMFPDVVLRNSVGYLPTARAGESIPPISGFGR